MPIHVVCSGCKTSFTVNDKFAGKKGPCPKCKTQITIPEKGEEIVIHAPEPVKGDPKSRVIFTPLRRSETKFNRVWAIVIGVLVVGIIAAAFALRTYDGEVPALILAVGAVLLGPPLAWGGYTFLRNDELEPYRGRDLLLRATIAGVLYAAIWGAYAAIPWVLDTQLELYVLVFIVPPLIALGGFIALACFDLEFGNGVIHYSMYVIITILLCLIMGVEVF